jgi:hypothetical protein
MAKMSKVNKILIIRKDDGPLLVKDVVEYEGSLWLVPAWIEGPTPETEQPARIICVDDMKTSKPSPEYKVDMALRYPLSQAFLEGRELNEGIPIIERPNIFRRVHGDYPG